MTGVQTCALPICFPLPVFLLRYFQLTEKKNADGLRAKLSEAEARLEADRISHAASYEYIRRMHMILDDWDKECERRRLATG